MSAFKTFMTGAAFGAAAAWLLDPRSGAERRAQVQTRAQDLAEQVDPTVAQKIAGKVIDVTRPLHDHGPDSDPTLTNKVRSEVLGRSEFDGLSINVASADGVVTLRGTVEESTTRLALVEAVRQVGGVTEVRDLLHAPDLTPTNMR